MIELTDLLTRARHAAPGWSAADTAYREASATRRSIRGTPADGGTGALVAEITEALLAGKPVPADVAERAHTAKTVAAARRSDALAVLRAVERAAIDRRDAALTEHIGDALGVLAAELDKIVARGREALDGVGEIRDAAAAIDAGADTAAAFRAARDAAADLAVVHKAHQRIVAESVTGTTAERDGGTAPPRWGPRRLRPAEATAVCGLYADDPAPADGLPDGGVELLAALLAPGAPGLGMPDPATIAERAENLDRPAEPDPDPVVITPAPPHTPRPGVRGLR